MSASTTESQARIARWISFLENRAHHLMDFDVEKLDIGEREKAAQKCIMLLGRYIELEAQLSGDNPLVPDPMFGLVMHGQQRIVEASNG